MYFNSHFLLLLFFCFLIKSIEWKKIKINKWKKFCVLALHNQPKSKEGKEKSFCRFDENRKCLIRFLNSKKALFYLRYKAT